MPAKRTHDEATALLQRLSASPREPYPGNTTPWLAHCEGCNSDVRVLLKTALRFGRPHGNCPGRVKGTRKLAEAVVRAVMLAAQLVPLEPYVNSKTGWRCRCLACGAEDVTPTYNKVQQKGHGCRHCGIARRAELRRHPALEVEAAYRRLGGIPDIAYPGVDQVWPGVCAAAGHRVERRWKAIEISGYFCTVCSGARVLPETAIAAMEAAGCTPLDPYPGSSTKWRSQCHRCHRTVWPMYESIQQGQGPCAYCGGNKVDPDEAWLAMNEAGAIPRTPYPGADVDWPCTCGRCAAEITPRYNNAVVKGTDPCVYCSRQRISRTEAYPLAAEHQLEPLVEFEKATEVWKCRCLVCGGRTRTVLSKLIFTGARGCPVCARGGFRELDPAQVYLVRHAGHDVYKIGIPNAYGFRLREHRRHGFLPLQLEAGEAVWPLALGVHARAVEEAVLRLWRADQGLAQALAPVDMPQHGFTETAHLTEVHLQLTLHTLRQELAAVTTAGQLAPEIPQ